MMKKILLLVLALTLSMSLVFADGYGHMSISDLRDQHAELKAKVDSGEITKEEARAQWKDIISEVRDERKRKYQEKKAKIVERIKEVRKRNFERAEMMQERLSNHEAYRETAKKEREELKTKVDSGEITKEEARDILKEKKEENKEKRTENRNEFKAKVKKHRLNK